MTEQPHLPPAPPVSPELPSEPGPGRLIATLGLAGFFSGLLLVTGFVLTRPIIEENKAEALKAAVYKVLEDCKSFEQLTWDGQNLGSGPTTKENAAPVYIGFGEGHRVLGFAITSEEPGFQDIIKAIYGYDPQLDQIIGMEILESKETPGLGDKIFKDVNFRSNFDALAVQPEIISVKHGQKSNPHEVEAITGATISSKAVTRLLQKGMAEWREPIQRFAQDMEQKGASEPNEQN
ncbi:MAG: FMN-binding protein [Saprospiraceae bacterium]|nr:FMN-binding protein [Saprospiraceae bacterium]